MKDIGNDLNMTEEGYIKKYLGIQIVHKPSLMRIS